MTPADTVELYQRALAARDVEALHTLADASTRAAYGPDRLHAFLAAHPEAVDRLQAALSARSDEQARVVFPLGDQGRFELVFEDGRWRVAAGGLEPVRRETPAEALRTLFMAMEHERLEVLRRLMPVRYRPRYSDDDALRTQLVAVRDRVAAARALLPTEPSIEVDKARAVLRYAQGRTVRFEREADGWTIADLE